MNWSHASVRRLERILVDAEEAHRRLSDCVGDVVAQCVVCHEFDEAPHLPNRYRLISPSWATSLPPMRWVRSRSTRFRFEFGPRVRRNFGAPLRPRGSRVPDVHDRSRQAQGGGGEEKSPYHNFRLRIRGTGAHPWLLGRRNRLARGMSSMLAADGRFSGHAISNGLRIRLNTIRVAAAFLTAGWRLGPIRRTRSCGWMVAVIWIASSGSGAGFPYSRGHGRWLRKRP